MKKIFDKFFGERKSVKKILQTSVFAVCIAAASSVVSCGVGLGDSVDTEAPKIQIEYPPVAAIIRDEFVLSGNWSDDKAVTSVAVTIINTSSKKQVFSGSATVNNDKTWQISLNSFDPANPSYYNGWEFADGSYQVTVTAKDAAGHSAGDSRSFEVDNTAPVFVISKPGVVRSDEKKCSKYGSVFSVEGTIADDHEISEMNLLVYDSDGNPINAEPYFEENISTVGGTSVTIARYVAGGTDSSNLRYNEIYGNEVSAEDKIFYCTVSLSDNAKIYKTPGDSGIAEGNSTSTVYLYDEIYDEYMSAKKGAGLSANDFKKVLNGTAVSDAEISTQGSFPKTLQEVRAALSAMAKDTSEVQNTLLKFSLNPNADPTYLITGYVFNSSNISANKTASANQPLTAVVSAGRDGVLIEPSKIKVWCREISEAVAGDAAEFQNEIDRLVSKVKIAEAKEGAVDYGEEIPDWNLLLNNEADDSTSDSSVTIQFSVPEIISLGKYYTIVVTGHDKDDTYISQATHYGFIGSVQGVPPTVTFTSPSNLSSTKASSADSLAIEGFAVENASGMFIKKLNVNVSVTDETDGRTVGTLSAEIVSEFNAITDSAEWSLADGFEARYENGANYFVVTPEGMAGYETVKAPEGSGKSYRYDATVKATSVSTNEGSGNLTVFIDAVAPVVSINSITPTVAGADYDESDFVYANGILTVKGNVEETNLDTVLMEVYVDGNKIEELSKVIGKKYSFSEKINTAELDDEKPLDIRIIAKDTVGNETSYSSRSAAESDYAALKINQATDRPKITVGNADTGVSSASGINLETNLFGTNSNNKLSISFSDDDSITQYKIYLYDEAGEPFVNSNYGTSVFTGIPERTTTTASLNYVLPSDPAVYQIKIEARDWLLSDADPDSQHPNGLTVSGPFFVGVDTGAPIISVASPSNGAYVLGEFEVSGEVSPSTKKFENGTAISAVFVDMDGAVLGSQPAVFVPVYESGASWSGNQWKGKITLGDDAEDKAYYVLFTATDKYGQQNSSTLKFNIDKTAPSLEPVDPTQTVVLSETEYINLNTTSVDTFSGLSGVYYFASADDQQVVSKENFADIAWVQMNQGASSYNANLRITDKITEDGNLYIWFAAIDNANNRTLSSRYVIAVDEVLPEILVKTGSSGSERDVSDNENIKTTSLQNVFNVTVLDTNISSLTCSNENVNIEQIEVISAGEKETGRKYKVTVTNGSDDKQSVELVAEDANGKTSDFTFSVDCDNEKPVVTVDDYDTFVGTNSLSLTGKVYDKHLNDLIFTLTSAADENISKNATVTYSADESDLTGNTKNFIAKFYEVDDGDYKVSVRGDDTYGNSTDKASVAISGAGEAIERALEDINFDSVSPVSSIKITQKKEFAVLDNSISHSELSRKTTDATNETYLLYDESVLPVVNQLGGTIFTNATDRFVLSGTIVEGNFASATISKNGNAVVALADESGDWTYSETLAADGSKDGSYSYTITIRDKSGHIFTKNINVIVDTTAPEFDITSPTDSQSFSNTPAIKGSYSDEGIGISGISYAVYDITETSVTNDSNKIGGIRENAGAATWTLELPSSFNNEGTFVIKANASDYFGKESELKSVVFYYDSRVPQLNETLTMSGTSYVSGVGEDGRTTNAAFSLAGTVSDTNALLGYNSTTGKADGSVVIKAVVGGEEKEFTAATTAANKKNAAWNYAFAVGSSNSALENYLPDGTYNFTIVAYDIANKTYQISRTVKVDTRAPLFGTGTASAENTTDIAPYVTTASKTDGDGKEWYSTTDLRIAGTASDAGGTGIAGVQYSTDSLTWNDFAGSTSWSGTVSELVSETTIVTVRITDNAGNSNSRTIGPWYIDITKPSLVDNSVKIGSALPEAAVPALVQATSVLANGTKNIYLSGKVQDDENGSGIARVNILPSNSALVDAANDADLEEHSDGSVLFSFTIPAENVTASGTVYARIFDVAGNYTDTSLFTITFDDVEPELTMNNPADADVGTSEIDINGTISVSGIASDNNTLAGITGIQASSDYNPAGAAGNGTWNDVSATITGTYSWTATGISTTGFVDNATVYLRASGTDTAGNTGHSAPVAVKVNQATDIPSVKITNLALFNGAYILKYGTNAQITGTVSDDDSDSAGVLEAFIVSGKPVSAVSDVSVSTAGSIVTYTDEDGAITTFNKVTGDWTFQPSSVADGEKIFYIYAKDNKGNEFYAGCDEILEGTTDIAKKPKIIDNKTSTVMNESSNAALSYKSDSDSPNVSNGQALAFKADGTANGVLNSSTSSSTEFEPLGVSYYVGGSQKKKIQLKITASDASGIAGMTMDISYRRKADDTLTHDKRATAATIGGNTMSGFTQNGTFTATSDDTDAVWTTTADIDVSVMKTGTVDVKIVAFDGAGLTGNGNFSFMVDNDGPTINISSPVSGDEVTGAVSVSGLSTDSGGSVTTVTKFYIPTQAEYLPSETSTDKQAYWLGSGFESKWTGVLAADKTAGNWQFDLDGKTGSNQKLDTYSTDDYDPAHLNGVYRLPVLIKSEDDLGNATVRYDFYLRNNPDGDKPRTTFTYPTEKNYSRYVYNAADGTYTSDGYAVLGGTIRITGNVSIPSQSTTVKDVYIQIDSTEAEGVPAVSFGAADRTKTGTGSGNYGYEVTDAYSVINEVLGVSYTSATTFPTEEFESEEKFLKAVGFPTRAELNAWWGIKASSTSSSWNIEVNTEGELNPESGTNNIMLRACGVNVLGKFGGWSSEYAVHIDNQAPTLEYSLAKYSVASPDAASLSAALPDASQPYKDEMYLKGSWYIVSKILDESGISEYSIRDETNSAPTFYVSDITETVAGVSKSGHKFYILVEGADGNHKYTITAKDNDASKHTTSVVLSINIDNTAPSISEIKGNNLDLKGTFTAASPASIQESNYVFSLSGTTTDNTNGSGFDRMMFYFVRDDASYSEKVIMDPVLTGGTAVIASGANQGKVDNSLSDTNVKVLLEDNVNGNLTKLPIVQGAATYYLYGKEVKGKLTTTQKFTVSGSIASNSHIRAGGVVYLEGVYRSISKIEGDVVSFEPAVTQASAEDAAADSVTVVFPYAQVIDSTNGETPKTQSAKDFEIINNDDGDGFVDRITRATGSWTGIIHSSNLPDGPVNLVVLAFDAAGNVSGMKIPSKITNYAPRLAKAWLGTDLDGSGYYSANEFQTYAMEIDTVSDEVYKYTVPEDGIETANAKYGYGKPFTIKNGLAVIGEFTGGNGGIKMVYSNNASDQSAVAGSGAALRSAVLGSADVSSSSASISDGTNTIALTDATYNSGYTGLFSEYGFNYSMYGFKIAKADIGADSDAAKGMSFTFWDSTEETVQGSSSQNVVLYVRDFVVSQTDRVPPKVRVNPFYWNSVTENSVAKDSEGKLEGHIELESDWMKTAAYAGYNNSAETEFYQKAEFDGDPKVSGKIIFTGTAYDDHSLASISFSYGALTNVVAATYTQAVGATSKTWTSNSGSGWKFQVYDAAPASANFETDTAYFNQHGHKVYWTLTVDTAETSVTSAVAETDQVLTVKASDGTTSFVTTKETSVASGATAEEIDAVYNSPSYQTDVVPYITEVRTELSKLSTKSPSMYSRTAFGHYPVRIVTKRTNGSAGSAETVQINGFNLNGNTSLDVSSLVTAEDSGIRRGGRSSAYVVEVNNVISLNNLNNNNATGSYEYHATQKDVAAGRASAVDEIIGLSEAASYAIKSTYAYNRQPNNVNNNLLTDDVYFDVWEFNSAAAIPISGKIEQPVMKIRPTDGKIGFAFVNGPLYFSMGGSNVYEDYSYQYWTASYDFFTSIGFAYDGLGNSWGVGAGGDINSGSGDAFIMMSSKFGLGTDGQRGSYDGQNTLRLERIAEKETADSVINFDKQRIKSPALATSVDSSDHTNVYLAYYDALNGELRFKSGNSTSTNEATKATETETSWLRKIDFLDNKTNGYAGAWVDKTVDDVTLDIKNGDHIYFCDSTGNTLPGFERYFVLNGRYWPGGDQCAFTISREQGTSTYAPFLAPFKDNYAYHYPENDDTKQILDEDIYIKIVSVTEIASTKAFGQFVDSAWDSGPTYTTANVSIISKTTDTYGAGNYISIAVVPASLTGGNDRVVAVWYDQSDASNAVMRYAYNSDPVNNPSSWTFIENVFDQNSDMMKAGEYCRIEVDGLGGVHIAAYDPINLDLCYAYLPASLKGAASAASDFKTAVVDANGVVGSNLTLDVALVDGKPVPNIGYYATSCIKPKYARFAGESLTADSIDGSVDDEVTGLWELSVVPTAETVEMQSNQHNDISIAVWKDSSGNMTVPASTGENSTYNISKSYLSRSYGQVYGNGTMNAVLGYAVKNGASGDTIETAQMK